MEPVLHFVLKFSESISFAGKKLLLFVLWRRAPPRRIVPHRTAMPDL
jgi:hypothetical protein